jgi:hypothetical protein
VPFTPKYVYRKYSIDAGSVMQHLKRPAHIGEFLSVGRMPDLLTLINRQDTVSVWDSAYLMVKVDHVLFRLTGLRTSLAHECHYVVCDH